MGAGFSVSNIQDAGIDLVPEPDDVFVRGLIVGGFGRSGRALRSKRELPAARHSDLAADSSDAAIASACVDHRTDSHS